MIQDAGAERKAGRDALVAAVEALLGGDLDIATAAMARLRSVADDRIAVEVSTLEAWLLRARGRYGAAAARLEYASQRTLVDERLAGERAREVLARVA